jgi:electron transfer flavoprotein alpha subunit
VPAPLVSPGHNAVAEALQVVLADGVAATAGTEGQNMHSKLARLASSALTAACDETAKHKGKACMQRPFVWRQVRLCVKV